MAKSPSISGDYPPPQQTQSIWVSSSVIIKVGPHSSNEQMDRPGVRAVPRHRRCGQCLLPLLKLQGVTRREAQWVEDELQTLGGPWLKSLDTLTVGCGRPGLSPRCLYSQGEVTTEMLSQTGRSTRTNTDFPLAPART